MFEFKVMTKAVSIVTLAALCFSTPSFAMAVDQLTFIGEAYSLENDQLLYTEHHHIERDKQGAYISSRVEYRNPKGDIIASKSVDFTQQPFVPNLTFNDVRTGKITQLNAEDRKIRIVHTVDEKNSKTDIKKDSEGTIVADAGFDRYIINRWDSLLKGKTLSFDILPLDRAEPIGFEMKKVDRKGDVVTLKINPSNWLIGLLMDPIYLDYSNETKRILRYTGLTNIPAEDRGEVLEKHFEARIEYRY